MGGHGGQYARRPGHWAVYLLKVGCPVPVPEHGLHALCQLATGRVALRMRNGGDQEVAINDFVQNEGQVRIDP